MSLHRVVLAGLAAVFTVGMTSLASAGCCGWGAPAPVAYAPSPCGTCGAPSAAVVYAQPVAPAPPPVVVGWTMGCGCHSVVYATPAPVIEPTPIAPTPIYVVNQGPEYDGPGIMVPYRTWTPTPAPAYAGYPYVRGYGYGARPWRYHARIAYRERFVGYPHRLWPTWRRHWHH
jgi:hypothetical protein